jgi:hypothetical protein
MRLGLQRYVRGMSGSALTIRLCLSEGIATSPPVKARNRYLLAVITTVSGYPHNAPQLCGFERTWAELTGP